MRVARSVRRVARRILAAAACVAACVALAPGCERTGGRGDVRGGRATDGSASGSGTGSATPASERGASPAAPTSREFVTFTDVARESGLAAHVCHAGRKDPQNWVLESIGGGAVVLDFDADGDMDLLTVDGDGLDVRGELLREPDARTRLWRNDGALRFTDVTAASGIDLTGYGHGGAAADYDGDGFVDVAVAGYLFLRLYRNRGDGTFADVTAAAGLPPESRDTSTSCAWGDLDGDGLADLFVTNYADQLSKIEELRRTGESPRSCNARGIQTYCGPIGLGHGRNRVYFQRADHTFEDRTATHLSAGGSFSFQPVMSDLDLDGDLDVFVANDIEPNFLYLNDGKGHLTDRAVECGIATDAEFKPQSSMGADVADFDRDGLLDVWVTNFSGDHNTLHRNASKRARSLSFEDVSARTRISLEPQDRLCWGTKLVDFDNDTAVDTFVACGHVFPECEDLISEHTTNLQRPLLMRGLGPPSFRFEDVTDIVGPGFREARLWRGAAFADFDDDGDWDVFATAMRDPPALFRNDGGNRLPWVRLDLRGRAPLTCAAGARVTVRLADGSTILEELHLGSSYGGSNDPRLLVGLGRGCAGPAGAESVPRIDVRWPDGTTSVLENVAARTTVVVRQR